MRATPSGKRRVRAKIVADRSGSASLVATLLMAGAGLVIGAAGAFLGEQGARPLANLHAASLDLRDAPRGGAGEAFGPRAAIVERVLSGGAPERLTPPAALEGPPRIIIVFDDMGLDRALFAEIAALPGPLTLSFLPYASDPQAMADRARAAGHAVMLHLPMEAAGGADPGPRSLRADMTGGEFVSALDWNLARFDGYEGVNNHMGSKLTRDEAAMKTILARLAEKGVFFLDSLTTGKSVAAKAGKAVGATVYARDVFLDAEAGPAAVVAQLALVEKIAAETGFALAIAHPRRETLDAIGPWLTSAPARGFRLDTVTSLADLERAWRAPAAVALR